MVRGDPLSVVGSGGSDGRAGALVNSLGLSALSAARGPLFASLATLALLWEVGCDPDGVEEVDNADKAGQKEEVKEDAVDGQSDACDKGGPWGVIHICGSKMLVSGSTTLTVPSKA